MKVGRRVKNMNSQLLMKKILRTFLKSGTEHAPKNFTISRYKRLYLPQYPSGHFQLSSPWHVCRSTCFSRTTCSLSRYNAKGKLDCFNCKTEGFLRLFTPTFTKESNYNPRFFLEKKSTPLWGIFNKYKEKLSFPRVQTAALTEY